MFLIILAYLITGFAIFFPESIDTKSVNLTSGFFPVILPLYIWILLILFWFPAMLLGAYKKIFNR